MSSSTSLEGYALEVLFLEYINLQRLNLEQQIPKNILQQVSFTSNTLIIQKLQKVQKNLWVLKTVQFFLG